MSRARWAAAHAVVVAGRAALAAEPAAEALAADLVAERRKRREAETARDAALARERAEKARADKAEIDLAAEKAKPRSQ